MTEWFKGRCFPPHCVHCRRVPGCQRSIYPKKGGLRDGVLERVWNIRSDLMTSMVGSPYGETHQFGKEEVVFDIRIACERCTGITIQHQMIESFLQLLIVFHMLVCEYVVCAPQ